MPKKTQTKARTQVKDLPKKEKKVNTGDMKKVKGGTEVRRYDIVGAFPKTSGISDIKS